MGVYTRIEIIMVRVKTMIRIVIVHSQPVIGIISFELNNSGAELLLALPGTPWNTPWIHFARLLEPLLCTTASQSGASRVPGGFQTI